jgi:hypothetical protein
LDTVVNLARQHGGLPQHIIQMWKLSTDPLFIDKVRDVVGLYMSPPENALVLCVDEKTQVQALDRTAPCLPMLPATPARMTHDDVRNGARPACSLRSTWPADRSSPSTTGSTGTRSSCASSSAPASTCTSPPPAQAG